MNNATDSKIIEAHDVALRHRASVELLVVRELITRLRAYGYEVKADNGEEAPRTGTDDELIETLFAVDEAHLWVRKPGARRSFVLLVFGNDGWDVISDYGVSLDSVMDPLNAWIEEREGAGL